jgi:hypothetical protein
VAGRGAVRASLARLSPAAPGRADDAATIWQTVWLTIDTAQLAAQNALQQTQLARAITKSRYVAPLSRSTGKTVSISPAFRPRTKPWSTPGAI